MTTLDVVLLVVRAVLGVIFIMHGAQKLMGWYGGGGVRGTGEFMAMLGLGNPKLMATMAGISELAGGLLVLFGLFTQFGAALIISTMIVAITTVHLGKGFFNTEGGVEFNVALSTLALVLLFLGAGSASLDYALGTAYEIGDLPVWAVLLLVVVMFSGYIGTLVMRAPKAAQTNTTSESFQ